MALGMIACQRFSCQDCILDKNNDTIIIANKAINKRNSDAYYYDFTMSIGKQKYASNVILSVLKGNTLRNDRIHNIKINDVWDMRCEYEKQLHKLAQKHKCKQSDYDLYLLKKVFPIIERKYDMKCLDMVQLRLECLDDIMVPIGMDSKKDIDKIIRKSNVYKFLDCQLSQHGLMVYWICYDNWFELHPYTGDIFLSICRKDEYQELCVESLLYRNLP